MKNVRLLLFPILVALVSLAGCTAPFDPGRSVLGDLMGSLGGLRITRVTGTTVTGESLFGAQTALPVLDYSDVAALRFTLTDGPGDAEDRTVVVLDPEFDGAGNLTDPVEIADLVPGTWTLIVEGLNGDPDQPGSGVFLRGTTEITVSAGEFAELPSVTVQLVDDEGDGNWELTLEWPGEEDPDYAITDVVSEIAYRVEGGAWTTINAPAVPDADEIYRLVIGEQDWTPGDYQISVELWAGDKPAPYNVVARYDEIWRIYSNTTTRKTVALTATEFAYGGGARFTINIDLPEDLPAFFAGAPDSTVIAGSTYTIGVAEITGATYQWRVNLEDIPAPEGTEDTLVITTQEGDAGTVLTVVLVVSVEGRLYSGMHYVRVLAPE